MKTIELLERPIISYIVMAVFSLAAAVIFFAIGGSFAEITGQEDTILGFSFKAGGAVAGFVIIFWVSIKVIEKLNTIQPDAERLLREYVLKGMDLETGRLSGVYTCEYRIYDRDKGGWSNWKNISYTREGRGLKIYVSEMMPKHIIGIRVSDSANNIWEPEEDLAYGVTLLTLKKAM